MINYSPVTCTLTKRCHQCDVRKQKVSRKQKVQFNVILHKNLKDQQLKNAFINVDNINNE